MQSQKMQRKPDKRLYKLMYSSSLKVSCLFLVHLPNSCVFAVNTVLKFQNFTFVEKWWGPTKEPRKFWGAVAPRRTDTACSVLEFLLVACVLIKPGPNT